MNEPAQHYRFPSSFLDDKVSRGNDFRTTVLCSFTAQKSPLLRWRRACSDIIQPVSRMPTFVYRKICGRLRRVRFLLCFFWPRHQRGVFALQRIALWTSHAVMRRRIVWRRRDHEISLITARLLSRRAAQRRSLLEHRKPFVFLFIGPDISSPEKQGFEKNNFERILNEGAKGADFD